MVVGVADQDLPAHVLMERKIFYSQGRCSQVYTRLMFWLTILDAFYQSAVTFFVAYAVSNCCNSSCISLYGTLNTFGWLLLAGTGHSWFGTGSSKLLVSTSCKDGMLKGMTKGSGSLINLLLTLPSLYNRLVCFRPCISNVSFLWSSSQPAPTPNPLICVIIVTITPLYNLYEL